MFVFEPGAEFSRESHLVPPGEELFNNCGTSSGVKVELESTELCEVGPKSDGDGWLSQFSSISSR